MSTVYSYNEVAKVCLLQFAYIMMHTFICQHIQHNKKGDCWIVIDDNVIDVSNYLAEHPGGEDKILQYGGKNDDSAFAAVSHSKSATDKMLSLKIGTVPKV